MTIQFLYDIYEEILLRHRGTYLNNLSGTHFIDISVNLERKLSRQKMKLDNEKQNKANF